MAKVNWINEEDFQATDGERLAIWRRRQGLTQSQLAKRLGCSQVIISLLELSQLAIQGVVDVNELPAEFTDGELLFIARRRRGIKQRAAAEKLNIPVYLLGLMETNKCDVFQEVKDRVRVALI